jgi:hypothetical protein
VNPPIINLPVNGAALVKYLEEVNDYESSKAGEYIKAEMAGLLKTTIHSWFKLPPPELDRALLRKISNSVLAAGNAGLDRTIEALGQLRFEGVPLTSPRAPMGAAVELREVVRDYRAAKNWLFNQSKCVNSVIKTPQFFGSRNPSWQELAGWKVANFQDWLKWREGLYELWEQKTKIAERLRGSYKNNWGIFQVTFDESLMNGQYRLYLQQQIDQIIHADAMEAYIEQTEQAYEDFMLDPKKITGSYELQINVEGSEVFFFIMLNEKFAKPERLNSIKSDLGYQLSSLIEKASSSLAISELATEFPTLCLRMKKPGKKSDFDAISASISSFCEEL